MVPLRRQILINLLKFFDQASMILAFAIGILISGWDWERVSINEFLSMRVKVQNLLFFLGFMGIWYMFFNYFDLYKSRRLSSRKNEILDIAKATTVSTIILWIFGFLLQIQVISSSFLGIFWAAGTGTIVLGRMIMRYLLVQMRLHGRNLRHIIIVGTNPRALKFANKIIKRPELGYRIVGFVDDGRYRNEEFAAKGFNRVTDFIGFSDYLRHNVVDEVIIGLPIKSLYDQASQIAKICEEQGIMVRFLSDLVNFKLGELRAEEIEGDSVVTLYTGTMRGWRVGVKRAIDIITALSMLILFSPILLIIAILIKITSPGPIFFIQERPGYNKRPFKIIKFRTMIQDADQMIDRVAHLNEEEGPAFKIKDDPRITKLGKFLRKASLDELPQLINVLKGEMSLVGPRPLFYWEWERIKDDWVKRRVSVKPGLTGLWQISGRSEITFDKRIQMDLEYIDHWSLRLDFYILFKTLFIVLNGKGAV